MADLADQAYGHCLAVTGAPGAAAEAASGALRRGGWSRNAVLGHAAHLSVRAASGPPAGDGPTSGPGADLVELARWLAASRPAEERAVIDLADRYGFGSEGVDRVAGGGAVARLAAASAAWDEQLDPALMAWLGPGACPELAAVLGADVAPETPAEPDGGGPAPVPDMPVAAPLSAREALALAPRVAAHAAGCARCSDRRRAMVSVRSILAREPIPAAPPSVRAVARGAWRRPVPLPPPALSGPARVPWRRVAAVPVVALAVVIAYLVWPSGGGPVAPSPAAVDALTRLPAGGSSLALAGAEISGDRGQVTLLNVGGRAVRWRAASSAPWLTVDPAAGTIGSRRYVVLTLTASSPAAVGTLRATVSVSGDDGSAATSTVTVGPAG